MKHQFILRCLAIALSIITTHSTYAIWIVGNMPSWQNVLYGAGDQGIQKAYLQKIKTSNFYFNTKAMGASAILVGGAFSEGRITIEILRFALGGMVAFQTPIKSSDVSSDNDQLEYEIGVTTKHLNSELKENINGKSFINQFGEIQSVEFNYFGILQSFTTATLVNFKLVNDNKGHYFISQNGDHNATELFIEPNFIPESEDVK
ncbi:MAG: hypothetical protein HOO06_07860 [Bdellovibrionaceae bacterium]|jgi:hypothetical protein|nr:hypothetical protein [Pseudobdellovibrionaceae bacterium]